VAAKRPAAPESAIEVDVQHVKPVLIGDLFGGRLAARDACAIDQDVNPAVTRHHLVGDLCDTARIRHVHDHSVRVVALGSQGHASLIGERRVAIGDGQSSARLSQGLCAGQTDAAASAGHESDAASELEQIEIHGFRPTAVLSICSLLDHMLTPSSRLSSAMRSALARV